MQLRDIFTWPLLLIANSGIGRATPTSNRREVAQYSHIQARALPNLVSDNDLEGYGLKKDSNERKFYDAFIKFENDKVGDNKGLDNYWAFFSGEDTHKSIEDFVKEYNDDKKHREGLQDGDNKKLTIPGEVYPDVESDESLQKAQTDWMDDDDSNLDKIVAMPIAVMSWRGAQRAAQAGGIIRFLTMKDMDDLVDGKYWATFEAYELTKEGTNVEKILRYNHGETDKEPKEIWKKGNDPLGKAVNWADWSPKKDDIVEEMGKDEFEKAEEEVKDAAD